MIGYTFFEENGFYWRKHQGAIIPLSLPHVEPGITNTEAKMILKRHKSHLIRWDVDFDNSISQEWWHIIKSEQENIEGLKPRVRNKVRKGGKNFDVRICDKKFIKDKGYNIYIDAFERYDTFEKIFSREEFENAINNLPEETEFWGVFEKNEDNLVAFSENLVRDEACFYLTIWFNPDALKRYSSYVLFYEMNKYYLNSKGLKYVSDGARSISHQTGIHDFLISKFGFRKAYSRLQIVYSNWLLVLINILFPFRPIIKKVNFALAKKISILLEQHRIYLTTKESK